MNTIDFLDMLGVHPPAEQPVMPDEPEVRCGAGCPATGTTSGVTVDGVELGRDAWLVTAAAP